MPSRSIRSRSDSILVLIALALAALAGGPAVAQQEDEVRKAREHYRRGEEAFAAGRFDDAYREFEAGYNLVPRPAFLLNMAHSERRRGELRNARALYKKFLLVDPQSRYRDEVEQVIEELDSAIAAEESAAAARAAVAPPPPPLAPPATAPSAAGPPPELAPPPPRPPVSLVDAGPSADEPAPLHTRWWFWAAVGGTVVAGVAIALAASSGGSYQKSGSIATLKP